MNNGRSIFFLVIAFLAYGSEHLPAEWLEKISFVVPIGSSAPFDVPDSRPHCLILEDATQTIPEPQATWLAEFQFAFGKNGGVFRRLHYQDPEGLDEPWKSAFEKIAPKATTLPYIAIASGRSGWEGSLPATREELLSKAEAYTK